MAHPAIITDTDSSLPMELAKKHGITQVPIIIQFGDASFRDGTEINTEMVFSRIDKEGKLPTTAAPSPGQFAEAFKQAFDSGADSILCMNISSEMSATYSSARQAIELFPGKRIEVMDTRSLAMGQGFMAIAAAEVVARGGSLDQAISAAEDIRDRTYIFGSLTTLKYIAMSGRVSSLAAGMAGLLDIKPILSLRNGKLELLEKIRTQSKSWNRVIELIAEITTGHKIEKMAILNVKCPESAQKFQALLQSVISCPDNIVFTEVNPGLSVHTGAGMVAAVFVVSK